MKRITILIYLFLLILCNSCKVYNNDDIEKDNLNENNNIDSDNKVCLYYDDKIDYIDTSNILNGETIYLPLLEKSGYEFLGWFANENKEGDNVFEFVYDEKLDYSFYGDFRVETLKFLNETDVNFNGEKIGILVPSNKYYNPYSDEYLSTDKSLRIDQIEELNKSYNCTLKFVEQRLSLYEYQFYYFTLTNFGSYDDNKVIEMYNSYSHYNDDEAKKICITYEDIYLNNVLLCYDEIHNNALDYFMCYKYAADYCSFGLSDEVLNSIYFNLTKTINYSSTLIPTKEYVAYLTEEIPQCEGLVYSKSFFEKMNLDDPFDLYLEGKWDVDTFYDYCKKSCLNKSFKDEIINNINLTSFLNYVANSSGICLYELDDNDLKSELLNNDLSKSISKIMDLYCNNYFYDTLLYSIYSNGFSSYSLINYLEEYSNLDSDFVFVPYPSIDGTYSTSNTPSTFMGYFIFRYGRFANYDIMDIEPKLFVLVTDIEYAFNYNSLIDVLNNINLDENIRKVVNEYFSKEKKFDAVEYISLYQCNYELLDFKTDNYYIYDKSLDYTNDNLNESLIILNDNLEKIINNYIK